MGNYDKEVREKVGIEEFDLILEAARRGGIKADQADDIAQRLGAKVGGNHKRRVEGGESRGGSDDREFRKIFSDWYESGMCDDEWNRVRVLTEIITILKDPSVALNPLAGKLDQCLTVTKAIGQDAWDVISQAVRIGAIKSDGLISLNRSLKAKVKGLQASSQEKMENDRLRKARDVLREVLFGWHTRTGLKGNGAIDILIDKFKSVTSQNESEKISKMLNDCKTTEEEEAELHQLSSSETSLKSAIYHLRPLQDVLDEEIIRREEANDKGDNGMLVFIKLRKNMRIREAIVSKKCSFFEHCSKGL